MITEHDCDNMPLDMILSREDEEGSTWNVYGTDGHMYFDEILYCPWCGEKMPYGE
jgi:hypothetical protein